MNRTVPSLAAAWLLVALNVNNNAVAQVYVDGMEMPTHNGVSAYNYNSDGGDVIRGGRLVQPYQPYVTQSIPQLPSSPTASGQAAPQNPPEEVSVCDFDANPLQAKTSKGEVKDIPYVRLTKFNMRDLQGKLGGLTVDADCGPKTKGAFRNNFNGGNLSLEISNTGEILGVTLGDVCQEFNERVLARKHPSKGLKGILEIQEARTSTIFVGVDSCLEQPKRNSLFGSIDPTPKFGD